ncbi:uncharacterized protein LOC113551308 [Rhopalosiphum maidis]|uniref:uncharacterized protein LOC113551308 n=1 Tax=Rhopalosiphum maidis TaxID=43146 RepID=UPI000EFE5127|nr:uncharacterized protein LOC113551308 [Rhopalosiphum maidis]
MTVRSVLNNFNRCFLICGIGSINYNQGDFKTTMMLYVLRYLIICVGFLTFYNANIWVINGDSEILELTSLIIICCFELLMIGKFISNICRVFFDKKLSTVLTKLEKIHEKLIQLNVVRPIKIKIKINWFIIVLWLISNVCECVSFCEYILLILYIKWLVNKINEQILEKYSTISTLRDLYLEVIECLNDINRSIYGLSGIVGLIGTNVVQVITILYRYIIFPGNYINDDYTVYALIILSMKIFNVIIFYKIGDITENEINRMRFVLHHRSVIERNPRIKRQIKYFMLRRLHQHYNFELYGICQINSKKLLILSNKVCAYLFIQILFKLNK